MKEYKTKLMCMMKRLRNKSKSIEKFHFLSQRQQFTGVASVKLSHVERLMQSCRLGSKVALCTNKIASDNNVCHHYYVGNFS